MVAFFRLVLEFSEFELESHDSCAYDYVEVREGSKTGPLVGR